VPADGGTLFDPVPAEELWVAQWQLGPANYRLTSDEQWAALFAELRSLLEAHGSVEAVAAVGLAVAGARHLEQHEHLAQLFRAALPVIASTPLRVSSDLESALLATGPLLEGRPRAVVIAGTGSVVVGRRAGGPEVRGGGWGHLLGDEGSGFSLGSSLLRACTIMADESKRTGAPLPKVALEVLRQSGAGGAGTTAGPSRGCLVDSVGWNSMIDWAAVSAIRGCLPLSYSGNPGVNGVSHRGVNRKRASPLSDSATHCTISDVPHREVLVAW
jgi:hypothetical protein